MAAGFLLYGLVGCTGKNVDEEKETTQNMQETKVVTSDLADSSAAEENNEIKGDKKLSVIASIYPMADFADKIGGDFIDLKTLVPPGMDAHSWEPSARDIIALNEADIFIYNGSGMEGWAERVIETVDNSNLIVVEASHELAVPFDEHEVEYINSVDEHEHEDIHEHEDVDGHEEAHHHHDHGDTDPHVWLDPERAAQQMEVIAESFISADPGNKEVYEQNLSVMHEKLAALDEAYEEQLDDIKRREIVVSHAAFGYLCAAYDLQELSITGVSPDVEPSPEDMANIVNIMREKNINTIFFETLATPKVAEAIAAETGARVDTLNPIEGLTEENIAAGDDYFSIMEKNLDALVKALSH